MDVDLDPWYVRVDVKGKITQLKFSYEIITSKASVQRSQTTGHLVIKAPLVEYEKKWKSLLDKSPITNVKVGFEEKKEKVKTNMVVNNIEMVPNLNSEIEKNKEIIEEKRKEREENNDEKDQDVDLNEIPDLD